MLQPGAGHPSQSPEVDPTSPDGPRRGSDASILSSTIGDDVEEEDQRAAVAELCLLLRLVCCRVCRRCCRLRSQIGSQRSESSEGSEGSEEWAPEAAPDPYEQLRENKVFSGLRLYWLRLRGFSFFGLSDTDLELEDAEAQQDETSAFGGVRAGAVSQQGAEQSGMGAEQSEITVQQFPAESSGSSPTRRGSLTTARTSVLDGLAERHTHQDEMRMQMRDRRIKMTRYDAIEVDVPAGRFLIRAFSVGAALMEYCKLLIAVWSFSTSLCLVGYWQALSLSSSFAQTSRPESLSALLQAEHALDVAYLLLLCLQLRTTVINASTGREFCKGSSILWMNLKHASLWLDFVSCLPASVLGAVVGFQRSIFAVKMVRCWRVFDSPAAHEFRPMGTFFLLQMVLQIFMGAHVLGTIWFLIVYEVDDVLERQMVDRGDLVHSYHACEAEKLPLIRCLWTYLSVCLHQGMYLLLGLDRTAYSELEHLLLVFCTPVGLFVNVYVLGEILVLIQRRSQLQTEQAASNQWNKEAMDAMQLPSNLRMRVDAYFTFRTMHRLGNHFKQFFAELNPQLHFEVSMHLYANLLWSSRLFHSLRPRVLREIVMMLDDVIYEPGDWICRQGDVGAAMYFVVKGLAVMLHQDLATELRPLKKSSYFGEVSLLLGLPWAVYVRANSFCILAKLDKERFATLFERWPQDVEVILNHHSMESQLSRHEVRARAFINFGLQPPQASKSRQSCRGASHCPSAGSEGRANSPDKLRSPRPPSNGSASSRPQLRQLPSKQSASSCDPLKTVEEEEVDERPDRTQSPS
eukprot:gb/GFBE01000845.1/.p1 GENE.gb/GFBE01000845.1/~~gb/GFBE01000845.1/.p1  ORF type:complete len:802 (+),score=141.79 gb/GFBE01000845.1/:1-2406(+)